MASSLLCIHQDGRLVVDYTIEFESLVATSDWNIQVLQSAYVLQAGLSEELKYELAARDLLEHLEAPYDLLISLDYCLPE